MTYVDQLAQELSGVGIRGRRRQRILAEFADHLECDPQADLGEPARLAARFADELGTVLARRAAFTAFASLAMAGVLAAVTFLSAQRHLFVSASNAASPLGEVGAWMAVLAGQVAFVAGGLAVLGAFRRRGVGAVSRGEARILVRRAAVGLGAGIVTVVGLGLTAVALVPHVAGGWTTLALSLSGAGVLALLAAAPAVVTAGRLRPVAAGEAGDVFDDFGPVVPAGLRGHPWRFALGTAAIVALVVAGAGVIQADPYDGILRGVADGLACLAGFGLLGRYLGLRT